MKDTTVNPLCFLVHLFKMLLADKWTYGMTEGAGINPYNNISKDSYLFSVDKKMNIP